MQVGISTTRGCSFDPRAPTPEDWYVFYCCQFEDHRHEPLLIATPLQSSNFVHFDTIEAWLSSFLIESIYRPYCCIRLHTSRYPTNWIVRVMLDDRYPVCDSPEDGGCRITRASQQKIAAFNIEPSRYRHCAQVRFLVSPGDDIIFWLYIIIPRPEPVMCSTYIDISHLSYR